MNCWRIQNNPPEEVSELQECTTTQNEENHARPKQEVQQRRHQKTPKILELKNNNE